MKAASHDPGSFGARVDKEEGAIGFVGGDAGRAAACEEVGDQAAGRAGGQDDAAQNAERLLGGIAGALLAAGGHDRVPEDIDGHPFAAGGFFGADQAVDAMYWNFRSAPSGSK